VKKPIKHIWQHTATVGSGHSLQHCSRPGCLGTRIVYKHSHKVTYRFTGNINTAPKCTGHECRIYEVA
jgi:hypothetical protein